MNNLGKALVIAHPETGEIVTAFTAKGTGKKFGKIRVDAVTLEVNNGFSSFAKRSAFITVDEETIDQMLEMNLIIEGQPYPVPGKIVVRESTKPFYAGQEPKTKGKGGAVILSGGMPVYRDTEFVTDLTIEDELIQSDKVGVANTAFAGNAAE